ncbi:uncharacterized protein N7459_001506 [Penicillium hispanicum]|uniref:uncharacterized protein n=1 Tax=Penicillium hispanicum TaxID=1080232 RepID=UPI002540A105|nr:uncharacterized protein N7459_001506 [Penicillium hispanicum]KAJ5595298.1 hypothetical protein N7459_001506 [Penicillium hispanicum]
MRSGIAALLALAVSALADNGRWGVYTYADENCDHSAFSVGDDWGTGWGKDNCYDVDTSTKEGALSVQYFASPPESGGNYTLWLYNNDSCKDKGDYLPLISTDSEDASKCYGIFYKQSAWLQTSKTVKAIKSFMIVEGITDDVLEQVESEGG